MYGRRRIRFLESILRDYSYSSSRVAFPFKLGGAAYRRLQRRLLRPVFSNVIINNVIAVTLSANERYVRCATVYMFIMFCEYMFSYYLFSFIMLFSHLVCLIYMW
jgi:hypothetical protein